MGSNLNSPAPHELATVKVSGSAWGTPIPVIYGRQRVPVNLIWMGLLEQVDAAGGKVTFRLGSPSRGFGGAAAPQQTHTFFWVDMMMAIGEGPIEGVRFLYKRDTRFELVGGLGPYDIGPHLSRRPTNMSIAVFLGREGQPYWGNFPDVDNEQLDLRIDYGLHNNAGSRRILIHKPPDDHLSYPFLAYLARHFQPLFQQAELPNLTVEVFGLLLEPTVREPIYVAVEDAPPGTPLTVEPDPNGLKIGANPADIITDMLTDPIHGAGFVDPVSGASMVGDLSDYRTASKANGWILSPACTTQKAVREYVQSILDQSNAVAVFSEGLLKVLPLADSVVRGPSYIIDANQVTHTPDFLEYVNGEPKLKLASELTPADFRDGEGAQPITLPRPATRTGDGEARP